MASIESDASQHDGDPASVNGESGAYVSPPVAAAPPPRDIPITVQIGALFGGLSQMGWGVLGFGMIFYWTFVPTADFERWIYFRGELDRAPGKIMDVRKTNYSEGGDEHTDGTPVFAIDYVFMHQGEAFRRVSYETGGKRQVGNDVQVEFPPDDPRHSRIVGLRSNVFPPWPALVGIFPLVGLGLVFYGTRTARRGLFLLRHGLVVPAMLVDQEKTLTQVGDDPEWKLHYEYLVGSDAYRTTFRTHQVEKFRTGQSVLYLPDDPAQAVVLSQIPGSPQFDPVGQLQPRSARSTLGVTIIPALTVLVHGGIYVWQLSKL